MKANLHTVSVPKGKGPFHGHDIRLTIGMIVKNEEKTLDKCLSSLKPLLEAVPSELIITDTGSTDKTLEIAKKYTDNIINFEWCGDFSAARNTGLSAARGEWFLFIDGDEWFEDVTEIIDFFNSGECDRYCTAVYIQRNYSDFGKKTFSDFHACRIFRMYEGIHFDNKIHESIAIAKPTKFFASYVNHFGYLYRNSDEKDKKMDRNLSLLKVQLEEHPDDLKSYGQLSLQYVVLKKYKQAIECVQKALPIAEKDPAKEWRLLLTSCMIQAYYKSGEYQKAIDTVEQSVANFPHLEIFHLDYFRYAQLAAFQLKQYSKAVDFGSDYLSLYDDYQQHKLDELMLLYGDFEFLGSETAQNVLVMQGWSYFSQNQMDQTMECINRLDWSVADFTKKDAFSLCFTVMERMENWELLSDLYQKILRLENNAIKFELIAYVESVAVEGTRKYENMVRSLAGKELEAEDDYVILNRLRAAELDGDRKAVVDHLEWFSQKEKNWNSHFTDVLYIAMLEKVNIMPYLLQIDTDDIASFASRMQFDHFNYTKTISNYFDAFSFENAKGLYWTVTLMERALLSQALIDEEESYLKLFESYARQLSHYVRMIYRPEMLSAQNLPALSRAFRFGYYMGEAYASLEKGNDAAYLSALRAAVKEYPLMEQPIRLLLERYEKGRENQEAKAKEFQLLAKQVKQKIETLIEQGDLKQAGQVTTQLAKLMPDDEDVQRYQRLTDTAPTMAELASRLPQ